MKGLFPILIAAQILMSVMARPAMATPKTAVKCTADLSLLDAHLLVVLDQAASLILSLKTSDPESAISITLQSTVNETLEKIFSTLTNETTRLAAREYLQEKSQVKPEKDNDAAAHESVARAEEAKKFRMFHPVDHVAANSSSRLAVTPEGETMELGWSKENEEYQDARLEDVITIKSIFNDSSRTLKLSEVIYQVLAVQYVPLENKLFVMTNHGLYTITIPENPRTNSIAVVEKIFAVRGPGARVEAETFEKVFHQAEKGVRPVSSDPWDLFQKPKLSEDGSVFAAMQGAALFTFNATTHTFAVIKTEAWGIEPANWALSPNGKYLALTFQRVNERGTVEIFNTATGESIKTLSLTSHSVAFTTDSQSIIANDENGEIVMVDFSKFPKQPGRPYFYTGDLPQSPAAMTNAFYVSPDGTRFIAQKGSSIGVWDIFSGNLLQSWQGQGGRVVFIKNGEAFISFGARSTLWGLK